MKRFCLQGGLGRKKFVKLFAALFKKYQDSSKGFCGWPVARGVGSLPSSPEAHMVDEKVLDSCPSEASPKKKSHSDSEISTMPVIWWDCCGSSAIPSVLQGPVIQSFR